VERKGLFVGCSSPPSNVEWVEEWAVGGGAATFIVGAICIGCRPSRPPEEPAVGPTALSDSSWSLNRHFLWRLFQPPNHLAAGSHALRPRHYRRLKRWLQDLPPGQTAVGSYHQLNRRFKATFDKVWNSYLFSENRWKLNIKKSANRCIGPGCKIIDWVALYFQISNWA
jgi:hypothetical protein